VDYILQREYERSTSKSDAGEDEDEGPAGNVTEMQFYYESVSAGLGNYLTGSESEMVSVPTDDVPDGADYLLKVSGDSMEPEYNDGDLIFVKACTGLESGDIGIFVLNGEGYCKRLEVDYEKMQTRLVSLNDRYGDIVVREHKEMRTVGKVLGVWDRKR
jgi:repressor LexA